jgi:hypothetical protein
MSTTMARLDEKQECVTARMRLDERWLKRVLGGISDLINQAKRKAILRH